MKHGEIWLVDFDPSFGHEYQKVRPALIVQSDVYISSGSLITVIPVSSQIQKMVTLDVFVRKDSLNRLMSDSLIKTRQISSFDRRRFIKRIGICESIVMNNLALNIKLYLNLQ
ncbi:type II toxin-antitoxin system PemK/MazF family toxin [Dyadobacter sp. CY312]|uniref:type II toxin-antitoxin system PemK/MazF family toxin n=1 Tax=Dyadobacter sp. CY312 TaxID=2907303 RepID=UPI001F2E3A00|nr:type II toxin-antitoxin system PemK/MazF family toxin [Dyadobacter sp. CY312]MCE7039994.1 type II toxin-antitoxin system PemK/MazF family toxin [Dyadobacter sp. CY312]